MWTFPLVAVTTDVFFLTRVFPCLLFLFRNFGAIELSVEVTSLSLRQISHTTVHNIAIFEYIAIEFQSYWTEVVWKYVYVRGSFKGSTELSGGSLFLSHVNNRYATHRTPARHRLRRTRPTAASYFNPSSFDRTFVDRYAKSREIAISSEKSEFKLCLADPDGANPPSIARYQSAFDYVRRAFKRRARGASRPAARARACAPTVMRDIHVIAAPLRIKAVRESRASCILACSRRVDFLPL